MHARTITVSGIPLTPTMILRAMELACASAHRWYLSHPSAPSVLHRSAAIVYRPEPEHWTAEHFDGPARVLARGWGDCDDLAACVVGYARARGLDASPVLLGAHPRYHVMARVGGAIVDPSAYLRDREIFHA